MGDVLDAAIRAAAHLRSAVSAFSGDLASRDLWILGSMLFATHLAARVGMWAYCLLVLPGTLAHELAHFVTAVALRARPSLPSLIPARTSGGWRLGSVSFSAGPLRSAPIAVAPIVLAPLSVLWASSTLPGAEVDTYYLLNAWGSATAFSASLPSRQDWRLAMPALILAAVLSVAYACL